jgi:hypothetical protein
MTMLLGRFDLDRVVYSLLNQLQYNGTLPRYDEAAQADKDYLSARVDAAVHREPLDIVVTPESTRFDTGEEDNELIKTIVQALRLQA